MRRIVSLSLVTIAMAASAAFAQTAPRTQAPTPGMLQDTTVSSASDAPIGPRDQIEIRVFQDPNLNTKATVTDDGRVQMPLIGKLTVSGLTPAEVEALVRTKLEKYINKPDVAVTVLQASNKPISVIGAVMRPGRIGITANITLVQAITEAGGLAQGYGRTMYVLRTASNGLTEQIAIDIDDLMVRGNSDLNIPLRANDVINVPVDSSINVYVLGEVMHPGSVQFRRSQTATLLQALAAAGGPTDRAGKDIFIKRMLDGKETTIRRNFRRIMEGRDDDLIVMDGDRLYIRESFF